LIALRGSACKSSDRRSDGPRAPVWLNNRLVLARPGGRTCYSPWSRARNERSSAVPGAGARACWQQSRRRAWCWPTRTGSVWPQPSAVLASGSEPARIHVTVQPLSAPSWPWTESGMSGRIGKIAVAANVKRAVGAKRRRRGRGRPTVHPAFGWRGIRANLGTQSP
jgi:hypothetical protein